jgi:hypothetical protein
MQLIKISKTSLLKTFAATICLFIMFVTPPLALAASSGDPCPTVGAVQDNLICVCNKQVCTWQSNYPCDDTLTGGKVDQDKVNNCLTQSPIVHDIQTIVNFLSAGVGVVVAGVIILGGIQYILAGGNATAVTAARQRIINGLIALFVFAFIFAFVQWLIPGGVF